MGPDWCAELPAAGDAGATKLTKFRWDWDESLPAAAAASFAAAAAAAVVPLAAKLFAQPKLSMTLRFGLYTILL